MGEKALQRAPRKSDFQVVNPRATAMSAMAEMRTWDKIDTHNVEQFQQRTEDFFNFCNERGIIPLPYMYAGAIGCTLRQINYWRTGHTRTDPEILQTIAQAWDYMLASLQIAGLTGEVQVIQALSIQHAMGVQDNPDKVAGEAQMDERKRSAQDVKMKYQDIPDD